MGLLGDPFGGAGQWGFRLLSGAARLVGTGYLACKALLLEGGRGRSEVWRTFLRQVYFTAAQAIPLLTVASLCVGSVVFFIASQLFGQVGTPATVRSSSELILRELMPLITILVIIGRSGTAMATELGTLKVNREDEILDSMAINMDYFVIFPRLAGMVASLLILNLYVFGISVLGGERLAMGLGFVSTLGRGTSFLSEMGSWDLPMLALKSVMFGTAVALLSCHYGLSVSRSPTEIPKMATRGVISGIFVCLVLNVVCIVITPSTAWQV